MLLYKKDNSLFFYREFLETLKNPTFKSFLLDSINYSIITFEKTYKEQTRSQSVLKEFASFGEVALNESRRARLHY